MIMTDSAFKPPSWLAGRHLQTVLPNSRLRRLRLLTLSEEVFELPDGDKVRTSWADADAQGPLVIVLHGLEGSVDSRYARAIMAALNDIGCASVVLHARGCGGLANLKTRGYHAGETGDLAAFVQSLVDRFPNRPLAAVGYSLGGNMLLKYLGEMSSFTPLKCAVAVSVPFDLRNAAIAISRSGSRFYRNLLLRRMKTTISAKFEAQSAPFDFNAALRASDFFEFDDLVTAPLHGFDGVEDYYSRSSSNQFLSQIDCPTLLIHARDDPFLATNGIPTQDMLSDCIEMQLSDHGGHVGFVDYSRALGLYSWMDQRIVQHMRECLLPHTCHPSPKLQTIS